MPSDVEQSYSLLPNEEVPENNDTSLYSRDFKPQSLEGSMLRRYFGIGCFFASVVTNVILLTLILWDTDIRIHLFRKLGDQNNNTSFYANLALDPTAPFPYSTGYGPKEATNHSYADELWESIDIDAGVVALPHGWAAQHNLAPSQPFPWDKSKGVYVINSFHTLHCLKNLHRLVYEAHHGWPLSRSVPHALHCLDHMRKDALCQADDFLLPTPPDHYGDPGPRGQARVCRSWDHLVEWAGEHHACYQHITDEEDKFAKGHDELERYLNCPKNSPYSQQVTDYQRALRQKEKTKRSS